MKRRHFRKATTEEILAGSEEMILLYEEDIKESSIQDREVPLWRVKGVLQIMGLSAAIESALNTLSDPTKTMAIASWQNGNVIKQNSPTVKFIQDALKLSDEQVDEIFNQAEAVDI